MYHVICNIFLSCDGLCLYTEIPIRYFWILCVYVYMYVSKCVGHVCMQARTWKLRVDMGCLPELLSPYWGRLVWLASFPRNPCASLPSLMLAYRQLHILSYCLFFSFFFLRLNFIYMHMHMSMKGPKEATNSPRTGVTGGRECLHMGTGTWI